MRHKATDEYDCELVILRTRREQALDLLVRSLVELDTLAARMDVVLERRHAASSAAMIHR